jgi:hypothetical protein
VRPRMQRIAKAVHAWSYASSAKAGAAL